MKKTTKKIPKFFPVLLLFLLTAFSALAQNAVTGKVTDSKGAPVEGVTVTVKGTSVSSQTAADGTFKISAPTTSPTLVFSSIGFGTEESGVTAGTAVAVRLTELNQQLNEVVVVGYGTTRKKDLTGAVTTVTAKDFQKGNITTPEQLIAGKVPGVSIISNGGQPGSGSTIRIRGGSSLNASNDPLIVVDGIPLDANGVSGASNGLSFINPNDIETFTVLKDASATAIYGTRGANGVIIITTKKGKAGGLKVNFSSNTSWAEITKKVDVLTGDQVRSIINADGNAQQKSQLGTANTDWQDAIYRTAVSTDNNISISGGIKKLPYRLSIGYAYLNGVLITDHLEKQSAALAINPVLFNNHLKVDINVKAISQRTRFADQGAIGGAVSFDPTQPIYSNTKRFGGYYEWLESNGKLILNRPNNPVGLLEQRYDEQNPVRSIGNIQLDYKFHFLPELHANVNLGYDISKSTGTVFISDSAAVAYKNDNPGQGGANNFNKQRKLNTVFDFYLNYVKDLSGIKSRIDLTAGYTYNNYYAKNYFYRGYTANGDTVVGTKKPDFLFDEPENTLIGVFGRLVFNFHDKYLLTATVRRDGSSRFAEGNKWGTFPSVALGWKLKEDFFKASRVVSDMKLRVGYGITGQQDGIGNYSYLSSYFLSSPNSSTGFGNTYYQTYAPSGFYAALKWEETTTYNAAIDYGLFNNRINGSVDVYYKKTKDLLNLVAQPAGNNFSAYVLANVGDMENRGVEFNVNLQVIKKRDVTLDLNFNTTYNKNKITNLTPIKDDPNYIGQLTGNAAGVNGFIFLNAVGGPKSTFYLYRQIYDKAGKPIEGLFEDTNRDGIINDKDKYKGQAADPSVFYGFSANFTYKKFNAGFVARANFNNYMYNNVFSNLGRFNQVAGAYTIGNASTNYLETGFNGSTDVQTSSDYYIQNASFLRMDNINLGYNFGRIGRGQNFNLRLIGVVQNVFVVTKYSGLDPEISGGIDNNLYPRPRTYTLGVNLDF